MNISQLMYPFVPIDEHLSYFLLCVCCKQCCYEHFRLLLLVQGQELLQIMSPEVHCQFDENAKFLFKVKCQLTLHQQLVKVVLYFGFVRLFNVCQYCS